MALKFLSGHAGNGGSSSSVKYFDIRLDRGYIVFRGGEDEAASAQLVGSVVLCLTEALAVSQVKLTLSGIVHMSWQTTSTSAMTGRRSAHKERTFFEKSWTFRDPGKNKTEILPAENYEWPFDCVLDGNLPESVEGLREGWIVYRLKAEVCRKRAKDIVVRKPLRLVRTLGSSALELAHAMSVENIWPNKIEYSISTPSKAVIFGSFIRVDFKLVPLLKGLVIGCVITQLKEEQEFVVDSEWGVSALNGGLTRDERIIAYDNYTVNQDADEQILDEVAEGFQFSRYLELPKSLNKCLQDCNIKGIKIRHKLKFNVQLHNPDGHVSELRANLPVSLYISPNLSLNDDNDLVDQSPQAGRAAVESDIAHSAPPLYGEHVLDQLYIDVDPSGYRTPGGALSTPGTPYAHSRNISTENLASLGALANVTGDVSALALQSRLQNLRVSDRSAPSSYPPSDPESGLHPRSGDLSRRNSNTNLPGDSSMSRDSSSSNIYARLSPHDPASGASPPSGSDPVSRRTSEEEEEYARMSGLQIPPVRSTHQEDLAKVPSYSTAVRTPAPKRTPYGSSNDLPSYGAVCTASEPSALTEPPSAHLRTSGWAAGLVQTLPEAQRTPVPRSGGAIFEEERRLRRMQQSGRG